jgi:hypothetical protein
LADGLGSGDTGAGVDAVGLFGFVLLFAFELFSVLAGSQAASASDSITKARSFFVMIVLHSFERSYREALVPFFGGEWE